MKNLLYKLLSFILGRNVGSTPTAVISKQLGEKRPLPMGMTEFHAWSDRIISGAQCSATVDSQKFVLAGMILHLKPTEAFVEDGYFINSLRKQAATEVAYAFISEVKTKQAAEQAAKTRAATPTDSVTNEVLANAAVQGATGTMASEIKKLGV